ncbi:MAG: hypothetical protein JNJ56_13960 [Ignavibacteria bacterium]|nr:hypothetical protein [Ignavibacteria bacterium]
MNKVVKSPGWRFDNFNAAIILIKFEFTWNAYCLIISNSAHLESCALNNISSTLLFSSSCLFRLFNLNMFLLVT